MSKDNANTVKLNAKDRSTFFGTTEDGNAVLRCADCGETMSAAEAETHQCPATAGIAIADGGVNFHRDLTAFQQQILIVLRRIERGLTVEDVAYGLAIKRELERLREVDIVNHGRLYPNLDELVEMDLIDKQMIDRRTNEYSTTETGQQIIDQHARWVLDSVAEKVAVTDGGDEA
jgi:DNA-binding HxlR family transcriptional regulator